MGHRVSLHRRSEWGSARRAVRLLWFFLGIIWSFTADAQQRRIVQYRGEITGQTHAKFERAIENHEDQVIGLKSTKPSSAWAQVYRAT